MTDAAHWNVVVSCRTDQAVREFLADETAGESGDKKAGIHSRGRVASAQIVNATAFSKRFD
jgi:hypothetical protein